MANRLSIGVEVPRRLLEMPERLARQEGRLLMRAAEKTRDELAKKVPGGAGGRVGGSFVAERVSEHEAQAVSRHPGAHALDVGAFVQAKRRSTRTGRPGVLKFQGQGGTVYRQFVRIPASHYLRKVLRARRRILAEAFEETAGRDRP